MVFKLYGVNFACILFIVDVLITSPAWTTYKPQAKLSGRRSFLVETNMMDEWRLTPEVVEKVE